ncbi:MAG: hypothetical protein HY644_05800 [Acidobacteria bacterium]|nr:hypothetical protein [Acidobacteriota bacterium]
MKTIFALALSLVLAGGGFALQAVARSPQKSAQEGQAAQKPPRVVGQPQTKEEYDAYIAITQATDNQQRANLCEELLQKFPDSGLTPYVHQIAATTYQQLNNFDKLTEHGEGALKELPDNAVILTILASAYADRGKPDLALERAEKAFKAIEALQAPPQVDPAEFAKGKEQLLSTVYAAQGVAYLAKVQEARAKKAAEPKQETSGDGGGAPEEKKEEADPNLDSAVADLNKALALNPKDDYSYFRLGIAYTLKNDVENAKAAYAKAVAVGGNETVEKMARDQLQAVLKAVLKVSQEGESETLDDRVAKALEEEIAKAKEALSAPPQPANSSTPAQPAQPPTR